MNQEQALRRSVVSTYVTLGACAPGATVESVGGASVVKSGIRHPIGNFAIDFCGTGIAEEIVNEALERPHFRLFFLPGDSPPDIESEADRVGLRLRYDLVGMMLRSPVETVATIEEALTPEDVQRVANFITNTFFWRSPPRSRGALARIMAACFPQHRFFFQQDEKGIYAAGTLTLDAEVIGLYNLCVRGDARSKGIGSAFAAELGRKARACSEHLALLCAADLIPWYSRQGYVQVGSLKAFGA